MSGCFFFLWGGIKGVGSRYPKGGMPNFTILLTKISGCFHRTPGRRPVDPTRMPVFAFFFFFCGLKASQAKPFQLGGRGAWRIIQFSIWKGVPHSPTGRGLAKKPCFFFTTSKVMGPDPPSRGKNYTFLESKPPTTYIHWDPSSSRSQQKSFCPTKKSTTKIEDWTLIFSIPTSETP